MVFTKSKEYYVANSANYQVMKIDFNGKKKVIYKKKKSPAYSPTKIAMDTEGKIKKLMEK